MGKVRVYQKRPGGVMKNKDRGRWQTVVRYQEADAEVAAAVDGDSVVFGKGRDFLNPKVIYRNFARRARRLGLVDSKGGTPTFHSLRHTFATRAIRAGVDVRSVASILGHSDVSVTLNFYAASDPDACRRAMETVSRGFADDA